MSESNNGRFRCIHCGCRFNLDEHEAELYSEGFYAIEPDCCDDCCSNYSGIHDFPEFSDADSGL